MKRKIVWLLAGLSVLLVVILLLKRSQVRSSGIAPFATDERVVFLGDSITQDGGFVVDLQIAWKVRHPESRAVFLNAGIDSDTAKKGHERIAADVEPLRPDRVIVMFGMNDVQAGLPFYRKWMTRLCKTLEAKGWKVDVMTPTPYDEWNPDLKAKLAAARREPALPNCADFVHDLVRSRGYGVVELYDPIVRELRARPERRYLPDRVHPSPEGHRLIASLILQAAGEAAVDPKAIVPEALASLRERMLEIQRERRLLASVERDIRHRKASPEDRASAFSALDDQLKWCRRHLGANAMRRRECLFEHYRQKLFGRGKELEARENAVRDEIFTRLELLRKSP